MGPIWAQEKPKIAYDSLKLTYRKLQAQVASLIRTAGVVHDVDPAAHAQHAAKPYQLDLSPKY